MAGGPLVLFCVDPAAGDPVASWFLDHGSIDEPVQRAFSGLIEPGMHVLDLGCHLGTFSLAAAALGASVLAVDAAASHVELLNAAAVRNGFSQVHAVQRAISDSQTPVAFIERSIHGHVLGSDDADHGQAVEVQTATVDDLLDERGWDDLDVVKMDIEGMEATALAGMRQLFARGSRPAIVFECNGSMLPRSGSSICTLRRTFVELGYELLMIDHLHPGTLVQAEADAIQPECVCDYIAVPVGTGSALARDWRIEPPFTRGQTVSRLLDTAAMEGAGYRAYAAELLAWGPEGLRSEPGAGAVLRALALDRDGGVRAAVGARPAGSTASEHTLGDAPASVGPPADMRVWARGISVGDATGGLGLRADDADELAATDVKRRVPQQRLCVGALAIRHRAVELAGRIPHRDAACPYPHVGRRAA